MRLPAVIRQVSSGGRWTLIGMLGAAALGAGLVLMSEVEQSRSGDLGLAAEYAARGRPDLARRAHGRWVAWAKDDAESLFAAAAFFDDAGDLDRAIDLLAQARRVSPGFVKATAYEGVLRVRKGDREAGERLRREADRDSDRAEQLRRSLPAGEERR